MSFSLLRKRLLLLNLGGLCVLLLTVAGVVYWLVRVQLYHRLQEDLVLTAQAVTFSVEKVRTGIDVSESIYLTSRPLQFELRDQVTVQWLNPEARVVAARGSVPVPSQKLEPGRFIRDQVACSYTLAATDRGQVYGYARVTRSLLPLHQELAELIWVLAITGTVLMSLAALLIWLWTDRALKPVQTAHEELELFTGAVSHELRTPLTAMLTECQSLLRHFDQLDSSEIRESLEDLSQSSADMARLVHDLLLLAQARRQQPELEFHPVHLPEVVLEARDQLGEGQITIQGIPLSLWGYQPYVQQILRNLLENAVRYSESQSPIEVSWEVHGPWVELVVRDDGVGLDAESCQRVFEPFWRADRARARHQGGAGLGLAIAAGLARAQHGELSVTSRLGQGSQFRLKLRLHSQTKFTKG
ncbi:HAMP domain-containing histidine kinase [bacterium]|nr:HAMP domain-containing histidine kinase [bacterium]